MEEPRLHRDVLARAWLAHVDFPWDEYGVAIRNLRLGLGAPDCGRFDNWFFRGMGAPIRSEIWACLNPGEPERSAAMAWQDASVDHAGDGIWGEVFLAALESAAFVENDPSRLLELALAPLPIDSAVRLAVEDTERWWNEMRDWKRVREEILRVHGHDNFTDAPMNIGHSRGLDKREIGSKNRNWIFVNAKPRFGAKASS